MASKKREILATGEIYHIFNRTINNEGAFVGNREFNRLMDLVNFYRYSQEMKLSRFNVLNSPDKDKYLLTLKSIVPLTEIYSFSFMPNHYRFLLRQLTDGGIKGFVSNFQNGFAKYYNLKNNRDGGLFKSTFRSKRIVTEEVAIHISRYIHLNPVTSYLIGINKIGEYVRTSFPYYLKSQSNHFINTEFITKLAGSSKKYEKFVYDQANYQRTLHKIKDQLLE